jgi:hypothetical protein
MTASALPDSPATSPSYPHEVEPSAPDAEHDPPVGDGTSMDATAPDLAVSDDPADGRTMLLFAVRLLVTDDIDDDPDGSSDGAPAEDLAANDDPAREAPVPLLPSTFLGTAAAHARRRLARRHFDASLRHYAEARGLVAASVHGMCCVMGAHRSPDVDDLLDVISWLIPQRSIGEIALLRVPIPHSTSVLDALHWATSLLTAPRLQPEPWADPDTPDTSTDQAADADAAVNEVRDPAGLSTATDEPRASEDGSTAPPGEAAVEADLRMKVAAAALHLAVDLATTRATLQHLTDAHAEGDPQAARRSLLEHWERIVRDVA